MLERQQEFSRRDGKNAASQAQKIVLEHMIPGITQKEEAIEHHIRKSSSKNQDVSTAHLAALRYLLLDLAQNRNSLPYFEIYYQYLLSPKGS
ncbi:hypothetical protein A2870_04660 [Candidatus Curtissbacteria bacterium RIFCSPHIGHO2_01_FULL_41_11]|uniref:Uncharacterized protein n=1 Tax=Candidatus Curtissbacteria bacterium RIFCSPHIGHO2_01_FULL_41_11 TaxID=1797711 RepID=A0A1F5G7C7_9BACT|nr:MAG: hypothetical protein A2870_04660 [Candidatus Curtissbacteria bacterium RIFCSPHIGHO2_01_FULL_41_11]